ncbi:MAG TPA: GvpL/GvpF family gas vesicle protein [Methylomirabilota bacterium]|nr:GvpL/GvpF family gas vesicle protein [Methylomirabilota bacterium]
MSVRYLYAVLRAPAPGALGVGLGGEPLELARWSNLIAVTGTLPDPPAVEVAALRAHDAVVRRLARRASAVLPARFGSVVRDEPALIEWLRRRAPGLREALSLVDGGEQMTLRVYGSATAGVEEPAAGALEALGPGARYLARRLHAHQRASTAPELAPLRRALGRLVRAERVERHDRSPLLVSVHHLVPRGTSARYRASLARARPQLRPLRMRASGPWPPYAFAAAAVDDQSSMAAQDSP